MAQHAKITPFIWYKDQQAEEAFNFYISVFGQGEIVNVMRSTHPAMGPVGSFMAGSLRIFDQEIMGLNGNAYHPMSPSISLFVLCDTAQELDRYWEGLLQGGSPMACGWLTDKYGVAWQVVPRKLGAMMADPDPVKAGRVGQAIMNMIKLDFHELERAFNGE